MRSVFKDTFDNSIIQCTYGTEDSNEQFNDGTEDSTAKFNHKAVNITASNEASVYKDPVINLTTVDQSKEESDNIYYSASSRESSFEPDNHEDDSKQENQLTRLSSIQEILSRDAIGSL